MIETEKLARSFTLSMGSKATALICSFLYTLLIANAFPPQQFGFITWLFAFVGNISVLLGVQLSSEVLSVWMAKLRSKKLVKKVFAVAYFVQIVAFVIYLMLAPWFAGYLGYSVDLVVSVSLLFLLMPVPLIFSAVFWGFKRFGLIWRIVAVEMLSNLMFTVFFMWLGYGLFAIIGGKTVSLALSSIVSLYYFRKLEFEEKEEDWKPVGKFVRGAFLFNMFKMGFRQAILVYLSVFVSAVSLGFYYLSEKITTFLLQTPLRSASDVVLPYASSDLGNSREYISMNIKIVVILTVLIGVPIVLFSSLLLAVFFPKYAGAEALFPFFVAWNFFGMANLAYGNYFRSHNRTHLMAGILFVMMCSMVVFGLLLASLFGVTGLLSAVLLSEAVGFVIYNAEAKLELLPRKKDIVLLKECVFTEVRKWFSQKSI